MTGNHVDVAVEAIGKQDMMMPRPDGDAQAGEPIPRKNRNAHDGRCAVGRTCPRTVDAVRNGNMAPHVDAG